jgi:uncharacterized protein YjbI with pentapeptide repeats
VQALNETAFPFGVLAGRLGFPGHSLTVIVKGTFDLHAGAPATPAAEQLQPVGDEFHPGDDERTGGPRYDSDFAPFKPGADLLLVGTCHPPGGRPVTQCTVGFQVGEHARTLRVTGNRYWKPGLLRATATEPQPFAQLELRYEHSFGGPGHAPNPVGKGLAEVALGEGVSAVALPNIEAPDDPVSSPRSRPAPAGFGPLARTWQLRHGKLGTYKGDYLAQRWPWFAADMDWSHCNAAPVPLAAGAYLRGDEEILLTNLHPRHAEYRSRLPGLRVRCFLADTVAAADGSPAVPRFREVALHLDTLWIDAGSERLVLVWRGHTDVRSDEYEEVEHLFLMAEPPDATAAPLDECRQRLQAAIAAEAAEWSMEEEAPPAPPPAAGAGPVPATEAAEHAELERARAELRAEFARRGIDPDRVPEPRPEERRQAARILLAAGLAPEDIAAAIGPADLPPDTPAERAALAELRQQLGASLQRLGLPPLPPPGGTKAPPGPDAEADPGLLRRPTREQVQQRAARGETLAGADLTALDLSGLQLAGVDLQGALLAGALLREADLSGANLAGADLAAADLSGASLTVAVLAEADLTGARLDGANLTGAQLAGANFERASLLAAVLDGAVASGASFAAADLTRASLARAALDGADLSGSTLAGARFAGAALTDASVEGARGVGIDMAGADLTRLRAAAGPDFRNGSFRGASAEESMWERARLDGADLSFARMQRADFTKATLVEARLHAADLRGARFPRADLRGADLTDTDLFEGSLEKADLTGADLRGASLYGAEFLEAVTDGARLEGANVEMTKLARR